MEKETYLGDGLYVRVEDGTVVLRDTCDCDDRSTYLKIDTVLYRLLVWLADNGLTK